MRLSVTHVLLLLLVLVGGGCKSAGRQMPSLFFWQGKSKLEELSLQTLSANPDHRREAALALGRRRWPEEERKEVRELLAALLRSDAAPLVRSAAAASLGRLSGPESVEALTPGLADASSMVRADVCRALGQTRAAEAIAPLVSRLTDDGDVDARCAAARALGEFEQPEARQGLLAALEDARVAVRTAAHAALRQSTGAKKVPPERAAWEAWLAGERKEPGKRKRFLFW